MEDWKGHRIEGFGELLLYGQFTVLKGDSMSSKNEEREVSVMCCKAGSPTNSDYSTRYTSLR